MITVRRDRRGLLLLVLVLVAAACTGCLGSTQIPPSRTTSSASATPSASIPPATATGTCLSRVTESMTEPQRIGQLFLLGLTADRLGATERAEISAFHFGSVRFTTPSRRWQRRRRPEGWAS